ncbi:MAG: nuclease [Actinomycetota bacterium]|nr:nuclease [Actinomycetota bacterium]
MPRTLLATLLAAAGLLLTSSPAAQAASRGPCVPGTSGPTCHFWTGKVTFVADGDTIRVDVDGDGTPASRTIRFTGINAMELSRYSSSPSRRQGACHAREATRVVDRYVRRSGGRVRLAAQSRASRTGHRLRRSVAVRVGGRWEDLGRVLMRDGHALWLPNGVEWAWNREYHQLAEQAAAARRNLYDPSYCGAGPSEGADLRASVHWDADGVDGADLNGEWVDIRNAGPADVPLAGWWMRDSYLVFGAGRVPGFAFPPYAVVPAGGSVRLYVGCGPNRPDTPRRFYWCQRSTVFENASRARFIGDGGYLFDPQGDLRASAIYPCLDRCEDPLRGAVRVDVEPRTPENVRITNVSGAPVDLDGYLVKLHLGGSAERFIFSLPLRAGTRLEPGERLTLWMGGSSDDDERLERYLGRGPYVLADGGNAVSLRSAGDAMVDCYAWGRARC